MPRATLRWIILTLLPLFALTIAVKANKVSIEEQAVNTLLVFELVAVEFFFFSIVFGVFALLFEFCRHPVSRLLASMLFKSVCILILFLELASWLVYAESGLSIDWALFEFGLERSQKLGQLANNRIGLIPVATVIIGLIYLLWGAQKLALRLPDISSRSQRLVIILLLISTSAFMLFDFNKNSNATLPGEITRSGTLNILISGYQSWREVAPKAVARSKGGEATRLRQTRKVPTRNVVIVILESTRASSVDPYVDLGVTPFFEALAAEGVLFNHAYTSTPHTSKAIYSILCGHYARAVKGIPETLKDGIRNDCLPKLLDKIGFNSVYFQSATEDFEYRPQLIANMGFDEFYPLETMDTRGYQAANYFGYEDDVMLPKSREWLVKQKGTR